MPSERFWRLPEEKRQLIFEKAMDEFVRVPFEKASINQIIQKAGISRGSFYTYFEDKRDLLYCVLQNTRKQWMAGCIECLQEKHGDLWEASEKMISMTLEFCRKNDLIQLHQNLMMYTDFSIPGQCSDEEENREREMMYANVVLSGFRDPSKEYFKLVTDQIMMSIIFAMATYYRGTQTEEEIMKEFREKIEMIRYGACVPSDS